MAEVQAKLQALSEDYTKLQTGLHLQPLFWPPNSYR